MTAQATTPPGATLHLGGDAWAHPDLEDACVTLDGQHTLGGSRTDGLPALAPYPGNPRRGDQEAITASLRELGLYRAIIVQLSTGYVLAGNHTLHGVIDLGGRAIPVTWVDVDDTRAAAIVARDNLTSDRGRYAEQELLALLTGDEDVLALSGYAEQELDDLRRALANAAFADEAAQLAPGIPIREVSDPIDTEGDVERVTVTVDAGTKAKLYALLQQQPFVRDVADTHVRRATT